VVVAVPGDRGLVIYSVRARVRHPGDRGRGRRGNEPHACGCRPGGRGNEPRVLAMNTVIVAVTVAVAVNSWPRSGQSGHCAGQQPCPSDDDTAELHATRHRLHTQA
jgi:hypothetical protein